MTTTIQLASSNPNLVSAPQAAKCAMCSFRKLCLPVGLDDSDLNLLDQIIARRRRVSKDEPLFRLDDSFHNLYAIRYGHFKTSQVNLRGEQQITGFQMAGDLLGMDAIGTGRHGSSAVALDDAEVCEIPFARLQELVIQVPALMRHFHRILSHEITREQNVMLFLGNMRAEQRFALFLLNLSSRYAARGYSSTQFQLRMSREDIGAYLGLTIESISRLLSRFRQSGWIKVDNRELVLLDRPALEDLASGAAEEASARAADKPRRLRQAA